jgi:hypothetical protein
MRRGALARLTIALILGAVLASAASAGELIRYRRADGKVGFTGDAASIPEGAVVLTRRPSSDAGPHRADATLPSVAELTSELRTRCEARWSRDRRMLDHCISTQTRAALYYRDMLQDHPPGSEGRALIAGCDPASQGSGARDFTQVVTCADKARSGFLVRHGSDPASLDRMQQQPDRSSGARRQDSRAVNDRLQRLRDDQDRADRELEKGRRKWGPRYRKAQRELDQAEERTRSVVERMRNRGCRRDTLACGGLGTQLENARRVEAEKRSYLMHGLVDECRRAGCQPGWLR